MAHRIELRGPGGEVRAVVSGVVEVGRDGTDIVVDDPSVSRRHLSIDATGDHLTIDDLGSSHGTWVNGSQIAGAIVVGPADEIRLGDTTLTVIPEPSTATTKAPAVQGSATLAPTAPPSGFAVLDHSGAEIRYRPGTSGEASAKPMATAAAKARRNLGPLAADAAKPVIYLVDPFRDVTGSLVTEGTVIDATQGEIWMVATAEVPPEDPHRPLALLYGEGLPAADEVAFLVEGYGLHAAGVASTRSTLSEMVLPPFEDADGDLRAAMAVDYVRLLLDRESEETFHEVLRSPAGRLEQRFRELYGTTQAALDQTWRQEVAAGEPDVKTGQFLRTALRYLRPYKLRQAEIFVYMLLSLAFTAAFPFVTRELFDGAIPSGEFSEVTTLLVILAAAFTVSLLAGLRQAYQTAWVSGAVVRDMRMQMFDRLQTLPSSWFHGHHQGDVLSRVFSDVSAVESGLSQTIGQSILQVLTLMVSSAIMLTISVPLSIIVLAGIPLLAVVYKSMAGGAQKRSLAMREENSSLVNVAAENYAAIPVVKLFGLRLHEASRFERASNRLFRAQRKLSLFSGMFGLSVNMIVTLLRLGVLGFGAWLILDGQFTLGGLVAFLGIIGDVIGPVTALTTVGQEVQYSMGALIRINEVLDAEPEPEAEDATTLPQLESELRLSGVSFSYSPERRAIDSLDAVIAAGTKVAFVGPSGSGKSTVLKLMMRLLEADEGAISIDGVDVQASTIASLRDQIGVVFQDPFLFDTTIRENIALGKSNATDAEVEAAAAAAEVDAFIDALPRGLDTLVGERGGNLSGGQRQRVSIARALIRDPKLLLLDEATSALDPGTERQINETLERAGADRTVIAITHRLTSVVDYDRIFVIDAGRLVESGSHEELVAMGGVYARLWAEQTGAEMLERAPFDAAAALGRIGFLSSIERSELETLAGALSAITLGPGEVTSESGGRLLIVSAGRGSILAPAIGGGVVETAQIGSGDAFGVNAVLGQQAGLQLRATDQMTVLQLDTASLQMVPQAAAALAAGQTGHTPVAGKRIGRSTLMTTSFISSERVEDEPRNPSKEDIRRATGAYPRMDL